MGEDQLAVPAGRMYTRWSTGNLVVYPGNCPGNEFFVDSNTGADTNSGTSWEAAMATIDAAVGKCSANGANIIFVHPDHAENLAADSAIDIDVADVLVYGIRYGRHMPTLTATAIAGDCKLAADNVTIANLRFLGGVDATTGCVEVSGADCAILNCEFRDSVGQATDAIITTNAAERLLIDGYKHIGAAAAGANSAIALIGAIDSVEIRNFELVGNFAVGAIDLRTVALTNLWVHSGYIWTKNAADIGIIDTITGSTGTIGPDITIMLTDNAANITEAITGATFQLFDPIYVCNLAGEKGMLINWTASTDA